MILVICKKIAVPDGPLWKRPGHPDDPDFLQKRLLYWMVLFGRDWADPDFLPKKIVVLDGSL